MTDLETLAREWMVSRGCDPVWCDTTTAGTDMIANLADLLRRVQNDKEFEIREQMPGHDLEVADAVIRSRDERALRGPDRGRPIPPIDEQATVRFWSKVDRTDAESCWPWKGHITPKGYGQFWLNESMFQAHRVAWAITEGSIPGGMTLDHRCRNRACCNPHHLEPVTNRENTLRGETIPAEHASKTHCPSGHKYDEENTYWSPRGDRKCRTCKREHDRVYRAKRKKRVSAALRIVEEVAANWMQQDDPSADWVKGHQHACDEIKRRLEEVASD